MFAGRLGTSAAFDEVAVVVIALSETSLSSMSSTVNLIAAVGLSSATVTSAMLVMVGKSLIELTVTLIVCVSVFKFGAVLLPLSVTVNFSSPVPKRLASVL